MEVFEFKPFEGIALSPYESKKIINKEETTINLGKDRGIIKCFGSELSIFFNNNLFKINKEILEQHVNRRSVLLIDINQRYYEAEIRASNGYYKLVPLRSERDVTLEINGIHMHRIKDVTPMEDAKRKVILAKIKKGSKVLEIGTGLGYTTINSLKIGANEIITIEKDENVLWLAERNPWSKELLSEKVTILLGNAFNVLKELNEKFDNIIHDPPRFSSNTSELYSQEFYDVLSNLLRHKGFLYHYTGEPGRAKGKNFYSKIVGKLRKSGFKVIYYDEKSMGILAMKI
ncbi:MAG: methyltransferase [Caldisphaera sp.]|jgi:predicted methyltransferase|nr:methyltransferase [Caldisphaera sp.]PMP88730.1 MAG: methyltransferase [Caldisphaera sp.]